MFRSDFIHYYYYLRILLLLLLKLTDIQNELKIINITNE